MNENEKIEQLTENLQVLTQALAKSEGRYQRIEGVFRWIGVGLVVLFAAVVSTNFNVVDRAYAKQGAGGSGDPFVLLMQDAHLMHNVLAKTSKFFDYLDKDMKIEQFMAMMGGMGDMAVLMTRVKQDSDILRAYVLSNPTDIGTPLVDKILQDNKVPRPAGLNSLAASPAITIHRVKEALRRMNDNMATMAYSMGSTAGRMGSWMP